MYLRGSKWNMLQRRKKRPNLWRIAVILVLIAGALYINQVVVPATAPLFIPTPTPTRSPESFVNQAEALFNSGKLVAAIDAYKQAILSDPANPSIYLALARTQIYTGRYQDALDNAEKALILNNDNPLAHAMQAWALDFLGDYTQAEGAIKQALDLDPNNAIAHAIYAEILMDKQMAGQGDFSTVDKASAESKTALALGPNLLEAHRARGYVLWNTSNYDEAIQEYRAALAINDKIADLHMALGYNYHSLGQDDRAVEEFLQAMALNPTDPMAAYEISRTYATVGDFAQAAQYAEQAVKADPQNAKMHGNLGVMYYKNKQMDQAIVQLSFLVHGGTLDTGTIVKGVPLNYGTVAEYYAIYGLALAKSNRCAEAIPIFQAIRVGIPDDQVNVYNAEQGLIICQENIGTPAPTEIATPTP
jgi:tetratricopeptide (TPR) repeat protein